MKKIPDNVAAAIGMLNVAGKGVQIKHDKNENFTYKISGMKSWVNGSRVIHVADIAYKNRISTKKNPARKSRRKSVKRKTKASRIVRAKKNPIPHYIIRGKFFGRDWPYYWTGTNWQRSKPAAEKFPSLANAKAFATRHRGPWSSAFPSLNTIGITKA